MDINKQTTRRRTLQALGTAGLTSLAGCNSLLEEDPDQDLESPPDNQQYNPPNRTGEGDDGNQANQTDPDDENNDKEPSQQEYPWQDILEAEQQFYDRNVEPIYKNTVRNLSNGQVPSTTSNPSEWNVAGSDISYTHGGQEFDIEHFKNASYEEALQDLSTLMFLKAVERNNGNPSISGGARITGLASEKIFEDLRDQEVRYSMVGNNGHGFWGIVLSPEEDPYTVDTTSDRLGETWEDPLQDRSGNSPITNFDEGKIGREDADQLIFTGDYQRMIAWLSDQPSSEGGAAVNKPLMVDANRHFSSEGSEFERFVPAVAVLNYQEQLEPEKHHVLRADSWDKFPKFRPGKDDFQDYRKDIESFITTLEDQEVASQYFYGEKV